MKTLSLFWPCFFAISAACGAQEPMLAGTTWRLTELDGKPATLGNDGRAATLELTLKGKRVAGFAGCNRMGGSYEVSGDSLKLGPLAMTKMACAKGMELEQGFVAALEQTRAYRLSAQGLELLGEHGSLARLEAQ